MSEAYKRYQEKNPVIRIDIETYNILMERSIANRTTIKNIVMAMINENDSLKTENEQLRINSDSLRTEVDRLRVENESLKLKEKKGSKSFWRL